MQLETDYQVIYHPDSGYMVYINARFEISFEQEKHANDFIENKKQLENGHVNFKKEKLGC